MMQVPDHILPRATRSRQRFENRVASELDFHQKGGTRTLRCCGEREIEQLNGNVRRSTRLEKLLRKSGWWTGRNQRANSASIQFAAKCSSRCLTLN
jgi:hypothetical protein